MDGVAEGAQRAGTGRCAPPTVGRVARTGGAAGSDAGRVRALGDRPVAAVLFPMLMGGALGPGFMTTQNAMLRCAPGRTDMALAANSGLRNAGIAAGAALGGLILSLTDVRTTFLTGGLTTAAAFGVLRTERLLPGRPASTG